ncbi:MAG: hypothetical protein P4L84_28460 [Isosphaeraceae bacterium]|nr:hypothetical protein [Isosphaeraceae bacterium]
MAEPFPMAVAAKDRFGSPLHAEEHAVAAFAELPQPEMNLAEKVRGALAAAGVGERCRIQVIVQMQNEPQGAENAEECPPDSSH